MLAWYYPELKVDRRSDPPEFYWAGGSDYGRYFHNFFSGLSSLVRYGACERERLCAQTVEWQRPVLESTLPDWYKFKLINSGYVIYTNMILNKKGDVTVNEGGMGGLAGTMDQRISSHPFYQKFFTQLDRSEMMIFADAQQTRGNITHFIGHYYFGMGTVGGRIPTEEGWMIDNTGGWIIQLAKDYEQTGDMEYLRRYAGRVYNGMEFLRSLMPEGLEIPIGGTTYDDFHHPPVYSYGATIYLATLKAARVVAAAMGDEVRVKTYEEQYARTQKELIRMLWNGRFFAYGCEGRLRPPRRPAFHRTARRTVRKPLLRLGRRRADADDPRIGRLAVQDIALQDPRLLRQQSMGHRPGTRHRQPGVAVLALLSGELHGLCRHAGRILRRRTGDHAPHTARQSAPGLELVPEFVESRRTDLHDGSGGMVLDRRARRRGPERPGAGAPAGAGRKRPREGRHAALLPRILGQTDGRSRPPEDKTADHQNLRRAANDPLAHRVGTLRSPRGRTQNHTDRPVHDPRRGRTGSLGPL